MSEDFVPGATAVGIRYADGVVLAAERRVTRGQFIISRDVKKTFRITDTVGAACAGMISDMDAVIRQVRALIRMKELKSGKEATPNNVAKLTSVILNQNRFYPMLTQIIIGGKNGEAKIFSLDPLGSLIEDNYVTLGTGAQVAMGVLEERFEEAMTREEAKELALSAIRAAAKRDTASGDGIDLVVINDQGFNEERHDTE